MMPEPNFVSAIITNENKYVLMILAQGDNDTRAYWTLPGGRVEKGETAQSALIREVQEETGLTPLEVTTVAYQTEMQFDDRTAYATVFHITQYDGEINPNDPEDEIHDVAWVSSDVAIQHLQELDYPPMSEPPIGFISQTATIGTIWRYRVDGNVAHWVSND